MKRKYYEAYDDRYRQIHERNLQWSGENASSIVGEIIRDFSISNHQKILEIGCGEGRDAFPLLRQGFDLLATDVSQEALRFCRERMPDHAERFQILDCVSGRLNTAFDFIYAVAVVHMLVPDEDRNAFYSFIREHLKPEGIALIGTMGDGSFERQTDIRTSFDIQERIHEQTGQTVQISSTSCRMVSFQIFNRELEQNGLVVIREGFTAIEPDFPQMMFAVVRSLKKN